MSGEFPKVENVADAIASVNEIGPLIEQIVEGLEDHAKTLMEVAKVHFTLAQSYADLDRRVKLLEVLVTPTKES